MHNIKKGHDVKASVGDMFVDFAEAFKKTKRGKKKEIKFKMQAKRNYWIS